MDLVKRTTCSVCEKVFCCRDHRRKHEMTSHNLIRKAAGPGASQRALRHLRSQSYALDIRKSYLYLETTHKTITTTSSSEVQVTDRKRKHVNVTATKSVVQQVTTSTKFELEKRKIIVPRKKNKIDDAWKTTNPSNTSSSPYQPFSEQNDLVADLVSPVEAPVRLGPGEPDLANLKSPTEDQTTGQVFTTSTPLTKKTRTSWLDLNKATSSPAKREWTERRKVVRFETDSGGGGDTMYTTAEDLSVGSNSTEHTSSLRLQGAEGGLLSSVAGAIQSALFRPPPDNYERGGKQLVQSTIRARRPLHHGIIR